MRAERPAARVGIYCDLGKRLGAGHFVRCTALGAALRRAGADVEIVADVASVGWAAGQAVDLGLGVRQCDDPAAVPGLAAEARWDVAVVDSYQAGAADLASLTVPLAALDDEDLRPLPAVLVVNQNLSADDCDYRSWPARTVLRGPEYALVRPRIAVARPDRYAERDWSGRPQRVLVVLGGTDAGGAVAAVAGLALRDLAPVELRVVAADRAAAATVRALPVPAGSSVDVSLPVPAVERLMTWADLVLSAAGTTVWELCCLGVPMALLVTADNQGRHYARAVDAGIAVGVGRLADVVAGRVAGLPPALRTRAVNDVGVRAWATVDGLGADRVARAVLALR